MGKVSNESDGDFEEELREDEEQEEVVDSTQDDEAESQKAQNVAALLR